MKLINGVPTRIDKKGYVRIKCGDIWLFEHRIIVENFIGRQLNPEESIHHLDHNRTNNDINNLMPFNTQKEHKSFENRILREGLTNPIKKMIEERWVGWK